MTTRTLTVLLADLVGSSAHVVTIPQDQAVSYLHDALLPIQQAVENHTGTIIKFTGDGYLATFDSAGQALRAAEEIRNHFLRQKHTPAGVSLDGVRVVLNTADITVEDNDILGDGVAIIARLEKSVPTNQVYVTQAVREVADDAEFTFEPVSEMRPRGWHRSVMIYQLVSVETSFIDPSVYLMITDLHGLITHGEALAAADMHRWMLAWGNLHREAVSGLKGRVRQFIADMALVTFSGADDAVQGALNLLALADIYNRDRTDLPPIHFKTAIANGDLILSPTGIVGRLVNRTFDLLNASPRGSVCIDSIVYRQLHAYRSRFRPVQLAPEKDHPLDEVYQLIKPGKPSDTSETGV
ncbi:MAG: hypothetical protein JW966_06300 [Anaerolineae bacterium]|nr:hypothetical protein [Anaerolineae bacterium]